MKKILAITITAALALSVFAMKPRMGNKQQGENSRSGNSMKFSAEEMFKIIDNNKDGVISFEEFENAHKKMNNMRNKMKNRQSDDSVNMLKIKEKFDLDKDGIISETERLNLEEFMQENREKINKNRNNSNNGNRFSSSNRMGQNNEIVKKYHLLRFDENKDGILDKNERLKAREEHKQYLDRFDKDGDGRLNEEEKAEYQKFLQKIAEQYISTREKL
ncbi:MAG: EF-hand domain-containing protein [Candidatus Muirbacterium halophilum]|nr:EF-hand domain-containing protein [Candidatus Muirbacterium halophilum]